MHENMRPHTTDSLAPYYFSLRLQVGVHVKMQPKTADIDRAAVTLIIMSNHFAMAAPQNVSQNSL